ncbi:hypothetical protein FPE52_004199 [Salmonella bongori]|uniref:Uncharacterized protein n=1 Tax=Salmonella bongori TaxID=54736 RepID=A0A698W3G2_SALBN|nr:hypothetical protein [Salmonella bongori]
MLLTLQEFLDQFMCISRTKAITLIEELQKAIDYMDAGIKRHSPGVRPGTNNIGT